MPNPALRDDYPAEVEPHVADRVAKLSEGQLDCLRLVDQHLSSKEIALQLDISLKTVEVHRYNILKKLKLKNTAALVNFINTKGL